jgi:hypothetical protein
MLVRLTLLHYVRVEDSTDLHARRVEHPHKTRSAVVHEEKLAMGETDSAYVPVTFDHCDHIEGPFYHGTKSQFEAGEVLVPGQGSNFQEGRISNNIYFAALVETAVWGAELATALAGVAERGHIYVVEPTGPFEDDPNVTNKRFPGNITQSYPQPPAAAGSERGGGVGGPRPRGIEGDARSHCADAGARVGRIED